MNLFELQGCIEWSSKKDATFEGEIGFLGREKFASTCKDEVTPVTQL